MRYIHYGHSSFSKEEFKPVQHTSNWFKPQGGLWGSIPESQFNWKEWCIDNDYRLERLSKHFLFELTEDAKVLTISKLSDLDPLPRLRGYEDYKESVFLDCEALRKYYDAVEVFFNGDLDFQGVLVGWDCDCIFVLNPEVVREIFG